METHLNDTRKFEKINLKNDGVLSFAFNQEKHVDNILKKLVASSIRSEETKRSLISVGNRPSVGFVKITKINNCSPFRPTLSAINTPTYKLAKVAVPILIFLASNKYTVKYPYTFAEEIVQQVSEFLMGSLDAHFLSTNILLEVTFDICANIPFDDTERIEDLSKTKFKELLSLATKESYFTVNGMFYKQFDGVNME